MRMVAPVLGMHEITVAEVALIIAIQHAAEITDSCTIAPEQLIPWALVNAAGPEIRPPIEPGRVIIIQGPGILVIALYARNLLDLRDNQPLYRKALLIA